MQQNAEFEAEELKQALFRTTLELESTRLLAQEELKKLEAQSLHLAQLLHLATRERDDARRHCHSLLLLLPKPNPNVEDSVDAAAIPASSTSSSEESSKATPPPSAPEVEAMVAASATERGLPQRGRLVEAVMRAGPLLQTLMLAGPLPQWRHPPPAIGSYEIPPVSIGACAGDEKKRKREEEGKRQRPPAALNSRGSSSPESGGDRKYWHQPNGAFHA